MPISPTRRKQTAFTYMIAKLVVEAMRLGTPLVELCWMRTMEEQKALVAMGRSKTLNSKHLTGLAKDFCFLDDIEDDGIINWHPDKYKVLGVYWESLDKRCRWGGRFGDDPNTETIEGWDAGHFEFV